MKITISSSVRHIFSRTIYIDFIFLEIHPRSFSVIGVITREFKISRTPRYCSGLVSENEYLGSGTKSMVLSSHLATRFITVYIYNYFALFSAILKRGCSRKLWVCKAVDCLGTNRNRVHTGLFKTRHPTLLPFSARV